MDVPLLTQALAVFLAPALPYLMGLGGKAAEEIAKKVGADSWGKAKEIWSRLQPGIEGKPAALEAVRALAAEPSNESAHGALRLQLTNLLAADTALAGEMERLLREAGALEVYQGRLEGEGALAQGSGSLAAGRRGVAIGGSLHESIVITGDGNLAKH